jgi:hypothetical protein
VTAGFLAAMSDLDYQRLFGVAWLTTVAIETAVLFLVVRFGFKLTRQTLSNPRLAFAGCCASGGTIPYLWFVLPPLFPSYALLVLMGELLVVAVEAVFYRFVLSLGWRRCWTLSLVCNASSVAAGLLLMRIQGISHGSAN